MKELAKGTGIYEGYYILTVEFDAYTLPTPTKDERKKEGNVDMDLIFEILFIITVIVTLLMLFAVKYKYKKLKNAKNHMPL